MQTLSNTPSIPWETSSVIAPSHTSSTPVVAAKDLKYKKDDANRLQKLNVYLPDNSSTRNLIASHSPSIPAPEGTYWLIYIHGGAWRDPTITTSAIEATTACIFSSELTHNREKIAAVASIDYILSPHPTHPTNPYDPSKGDSGDPAREAHHPQHVLDIIYALNFLHNTFSLRNNGYILAGHSAGATLACQATFLPPSTWSKDTSLIEPPTPAAIFGMNGLYDLPLLVHKPSTHAHLRDVYAAFLQIAFGEDESVWKTASPASFDEQTILTRLTENSMPSLIMLAQSSEDQLVPMNQTEAMEVLLRKIFKLQPSGGTPLHFERGNKLTGQHDDCWKIGQMTWDSVRDILNMVRLKKGL